MAQWEKVQVSPKIDLDTAGCALLMGVTREEVVEVVRSGHALLADLGNHRILSIEVGGSGRIESNCFDHHSEGGPHRAATWQAYDSNRWRKVWAFRPYREETLWRLVKYIDRLDVEGPSGLGRRSEAEEFPYLSDVFAGMLITERDPVEQLHRGVEILREIVERDIDPFGRVPIEGIDRFAIYAAAKAENNRQVAKALERAQWTNTEQGRRLAYLESDFFGALGALYRAGAEIVVVYSPRFGNPPVPKFTVAGNGIRVDAALPKLNALESGWGGPATGMILGSPREGSNLTLKQVVEVVQEAL